MVLSTDDLAKSPLSTYEIFCSENESIVAQKQSANPVLITPLKKNEHNFLHFNNGYYLEKEPYTNSPVQIKCDALTKNILVTSIDKATDPLSILSLKGSSMRFLFQADVNRMKWDENWSFHSTNVLEVSNSFLDDPPDNGIFINEDLNPQQLWSYKKKITQDTTVEIEFDSGWEDDTPKIVIDISRIPENQNSGLNWSLGDGKNLKLHSYKTRWYFHAF
ncbi:MAG: hypothetical protein ACXVCP_20275 [Bdellovibrio sp.]